ncbi:MAG: helix-turn-helix transcriptional regulator [Firmicutes bacterium]|nr:helix-turn-helix transcriptional regulator [Bacillota bacterium]
MAEAVEAPVNGPRLKALRERAGMTQAQAARAAGLSRSALATAEQGRSRLGPEAVARLLAAYGAGTDSGGAAAGPGEPGSKARDPAQRPPSRRRAPRGRGTEPRRPAVPGVGGCPHDRAVVDAMADEGMACRCLDCGEAFWDAWGCAR